ncbi:MAG: energy transducer TonB [Rikenellaceae bacterium]|nr:energy transducer TonB [Rikenellaceae bacterium]
MKKICCFVFLITVILAFPTAHASEKDKIDIPAKFQGGDVSSFSRWVQSELKYPAALNKNPIPGGVKAKFAINTKGELVDIKILEYTDKHFADETLRVLKSSPL